MSLDVVLIHPKTGAREVILQLDDSGEYWFMAQFWPSSSTTGKVIDLYGDTVFGGANLAQLDGALERVARAIENKPAECAQPFGKRQNGAPSNRTIRRGSVLRAVSQLRAAAARAQNDGAELHFLGD